MKYKELTFQIPELRGISSKQIDVHLALYAGYVKHTNLLREQIHDLENIDKDKYAYAIAELRRRLGFEFDGMRMHEYYFAQFKHEALPPQEQSALRDAVTRKYGSWEHFIEHVVAVAKMRGIGWTILYYDRIGKTPHVAWVSDHELGQLAGLPVILALDMWEHAFMVDYTPAEKGTYIQAFFDNLNWSVCENRFMSAQ